MADGTGLSIGATAGILGAGLALAVGVGALIWSGGPEPEPVAATAADSTADPAVAAAAEPAAVAGALPEPLPEPEPEALPETAAVAGDPAPLPAPAEPETNQPPPAEGAAPAFDLVRIEPGGATVVAGTAVPGATVAVLVDAGTVAEATANARGEFVAMLDLPPSASPRLLTLLSVAPDGSRATSPEPVVLAPAPLPVAETTDAGEAVAAVAPELEPATEPPPPAAAGPEPVAETAPPAPVAIRLGEEGAEVLTQPPSAPAPVAIAAISYTDIGAVRIAGTGTPGATVRLYLDNAALTEMAVGAYGGWGGTLPEVAPGLYTLRADEIGAEGKVISRFETPFQRETPERLAEVLGIPLPHASPPQAAPTETAAVSPEPEPVTEPAAAASAPAPGPDPVPDIDPAEPETAVAPAQEVLAEAPAEAPAARTDTAPAVAAVPEVQPVEQVAVAEVASAPDPAPVAPDVAAAAPEPAPEPAAVANAAPAPLAVAPVAEPLAPVVAAPAPAVVAPPAPVTVTVQPGFTLWGIAEGQWGDGMLYVQVFDVNRDKIRDPDLIYPGQVFVMPDPG